MALEIYFQSLVLQLQLKELEQLKNATDWVLELDTNTVAFMH